MTMTHAGLPYEWAISIVIAMLLLSFLAMIKKAPKTTDTPNQISYSLTKIPFIASRLPNVDLFW